MREIKFRAWDSISNVLHPWSSIINIGLGGFMLDHYTLEQFTGLQDKNGVDIYEGDKLRRQNGKIDVVVFDSGSFCVKHENGDMDFIAYNNQFEITGNIHES